MIKFSPQKQKFVDAATEMFGVGSVINKQQIRQSSEQAGVPLAGWFMKQYKVGYNQFKLPNGETAPTTITSAPADTGETTVMNLIATNMERQNLVPSKFEGFVPWGHHNTIKQIVKSGLFLAAGSDQIKRRISRRNISKRVSERQHK